MQEYVKTVTELMGDAAPASTDEATSKFDANADAGTDVLRKIEGNAAHLN